MPDRVDRWDGLARLQVYCPCAPSYACKSQHTAHHPCLPLCPLSSRIMQAADKNKVRRLCRLAGTCYWAERTGQLPSCPCIYAAAGLAHLNEKCMCMHAGRQDLVLRVLQSDPLPEGVPLRQAMPTTMARPANGWQHRFGLLIERQSGSKE